MDLKRVFKQKWWWWWWWRRRRWWRSKWLWWWRWWWPTAVGIHFALQVWTKCRPSGHQAAGGPNLGPLPAWSPLGLHLVFTWSTWSASTNWSSFATHIQCQKALQICTACFLRIKFAKCTWTVMHNRWIEITNWIRLFDSKRTWMFMREYAQCIAHAACAMCAEQCLNARVVHVCRPLCVDLCVCAPLCTCSAVAHLGLHANCTFNWFCLCLEIWRCALRIQVRTMCLACQMHVSSNSYIVLESAKFWIDFESAQIQFYEMTIEINCAWTTWIVR